MLAPDFLLAAPVDVALLGTQFSRGSGLVGDYVVQAGGSGFDKLRSVLPPVF